MVDGLRQRCLGQRDAKIRTLAVVDDYTRECLALEIDTSLGGQPGATGAGKNLVFHRRGSQNPSHRTVDNGAEFRGRVMTAWSQRTRCATGFHTSGQAGSDAYAESFNGRLREECLNANWFTSLSDARRKIEDWRQDYNQQRPHSSLNYLPPAEFARQQLEMRA